MKFCDGREDYAAVAAINDIYADIHVKYWLERILFLLKFFDFMKWLIQYIIGDERHFQNFFLSMIVFMFFTTIITIVVGICIKGIVK